MKTSDNLVEAFGNWQAAHAEAMEAATRTIQDDDMDLTATILERAVKSMAYIAVQIRNEANRRAGVPS